MKLDREAERWYSRRVAAAMFVLLALGLIGYFLKDPFTLTIGSVFVLACGSYLCLWLMVWSLEAKRMTREHMGLKPHWTDSAIDELEARVEKLERERP